MSYTTGGQTIDKSMNGIITFDTGGGVVISGDTITAPVMNVTSLFSSTLSCNNFFLYNFATFSGGASFNFGFTAADLISSTSEIHSDTLLSSGSNITAGGIVIAPFLNATSAVYFDVNQLIKAAVSAGRLTFTNLSTPSGSRSYQFINGITSLLLMENALITLGVPATTASNVSLTGTSILSLASGTSLSLASGSSMSSAGNISLISAANLTTSASGIFFNSAQDISIKALLSQLQFNIANTATAPRSYQFKLAALTPLLIEATTTTITNSATATASVNALEIKNSEATPSQINILLNAAAATANPNVAAGDDVIFSNGGILNLTTTSATAVGIRMSPTDIQTKATTTTLTGTTLNNDIATTTFSGATTNLSSLTTTIAGTICNHNSTTNSFTGTTTNLTSGTTNINGATLTTISTPTTTITGTQTNLNATGTTIKNPQTATSSAIALTIINSVVSPNPNAISFGCNLGGGAYNGIVQAGDAAIIAGGAVGTQNLCITSHSNTPVGMRLTAAGAVAITGTTTIPNAVTQAATESSTNVATTAYVNRANYFTDPLELYFNVGVGGGSGTLNLKRMNYDPIFATTSNSFTLQMNFNAMRLDQGVTYTGVTTNYPGSPAGGQLRVGMYNAAGTLLASTGTYTSVGTGGFHSINFSATYTPTANTMVWIGTHVLVSTTTSQFATTAGIWSAGNPSPAPSTTLCTGRAFYITKPAAFPTTLNGVAKTAQNFFYWYGVY